MTNAHSRNGYRWTINEVLSLQREFELLNLSIDEIASRHNRTVNSIMYKLDQEGFANYNDLYHNLRTNILSSKETSVLNLDSDEEYDDDDDQDYVPCDEDEDEDDEDDDEDDEVENLSLRVNQLEGSVNEIKDMIRQMMNSVNIQTTVSNTI
jgi:hypothetical protein